VVAGTGGSLQHLIEDRKKDQNCGGEAKAPQCNRYVNDGMREGQSRYTSEGVEALGLRLDQDAATYSQEGIRAAYCCSLAYNATEALISGCNLVLEPCFQGGSRSGIGRKFQRLDREGI
jgi:hypothetical protein